MKAVYDHRALASFRVFLDHYIGEELEAFSNEALHLYETTDVNYPNLSTYSAPIYQWHYDSSISNVVIPTGVIEGVVPVGRGTDGLILDFENGRAIFNSGTHTGETGMYVSGSVKEINTYVTTKSEQKLVNEMQFLTHPAMAARTEAMPPNQILAPCIFIRPISRENDPAAFGGLDWTKLQIRCVVFGNDWQVIALQALFTDLQHSNIPVFDANDLPLDEYGDIKSGSFNYNTLVAADYTTPEKMAFLEKVYFSMYENDALSKHHPSLRVGFGDVTLTKGRYSHDP